MKRMFIVMLALLMTLSMAACGNGASDGDSDKTTKPAIDTTKPAGNYTTEPDETQPKLPVTGGELTEKVLRNYPEAPVSDFVYANSINIDGGIRIDSYTGSDDIVVIPGEIDGKPVVEIAVYTFANDSTVRGVVIPKTVKRIKELFVNNINLEIVIAEGLEEAGYLTFGNCFNVREIILGDDVTRLGEFAFGVCTALERIYIPSDTMEEIHEYAFFDSKNVTIYGKAGSDIETFANEQGIPFVAE